MFNDHLPKQICDVVTVMCEVARVGILTVGITGTVCNEEAGEGKAGTGNTKQCVMEKL